MSKKYGAGITANRDADATDWLTGSLVKPEPKRMSKLEIYDNDFE